MAKNQPKHKREKEPEWFGLATIPGQGSINKEALTSRNILENEIIPTVSSFTSSSF